MCNRQVAKLVENCFNELCYSVDVERFSVEFMEDSLDLFLEEIVEESKGHLKEHDELSTTILNDLVSSLSRLTILEGHQAVSSG